MENVLEQNNFRRQLTASRIQGLKEQSEEQAKEQAQKVAKKQARKVINKAVTKMFSHVAGATVIAIVVTLMIWIMQLIFPKILGETDFYEKILLVVLSFVLIIAFIIIAFILSAIIYVLTDPVDAVVTLGASIIGVFKSFF
jgi:hypothetical protein